MSIESGPFSPKQEKTDKFDISKCVADLESRSSDAEYGDLEIFRNLKTKYPELKGIAIKVGEGMRGANYITIYFVKSKDGIIEVKLVDGQIGNYEGGTIWQEGDSEDGLQKILEKL